jgi:hypothetical protein
VAERKASDFGVLAGMKVEIMKLSKRFGLHFSCCHQSTEHDVPYISTLRYQFHCETYFRITFFDTLHPEDDE